MQLPNLFLCVFVEFPFFCAYFLVFFELRSNFYPTLIAPSMFSVLFPISAFMRASLIFSKIWNFLNIRVCNMRRETNMRISGVVSLLRSSARKKKRVWRRRITRPRIWTLIISSAIIRIRDMWGRKNLNHDILTKGRDTWVTVILHLLSDQNI